MLNIVLINRSDLMLKPFWIVGCSVHVSLSTHSIWIWSTSQINCFGAVQCVIKSLFTITDQQVKLNMWEEPELYSDPPPPPTPPVAFLFVLWLRGSLLIDSIHENVFWWALDKCVRWRIREGERDRERAELQRAQDVPAESCALLINTQNAFLVSSRVSLWTSHCELCETAALNTNPHFVIII